LPFSGDFYPLLLPFSGDSRCRFLAIALPFSGDWPKKAVWDSIFFGPMLHCILLIFKSFKRMQQQQETQIFESTVHRAETHQLTGLEFGQAPWTPSPIGLARASERREVQVQ
jgi:hypothetical protein